MVDEAYYEFSGVTAQVLLRRFSNLIIVRSLSKAFGRSGIRIGYVLAAPEIITQLETLKGPPYIINHYGLKMVSRFRRKDFNQVKKYATGVRRARNKLAKILQGAGLEVYPSAANFLTVKVDNSDQVTTALSKHGIIVANLNHYPDSGNLLENHLRIGIP